MMKRINWVTAVFLISTPVAASVWGALRVYEHGVTLEQLAFFFVYLAVTAMSITAGYHRLFAHRAYEARPLVRAAYLLFGAAAFQDSALAWATDHRAHHQNIDRDGDPYNVRRGFLWAHIGWLLVTDHIRDRRAAPPDLAADWMVVAQDRYYTIVATGMCFGLPLLVGLAVGDPWGFLLWGGLVRVVVGHHITFLVNSLAHTLGRRPYEPAFSARDSVVTAVLTFGEGYHNFHHRFASDYRNGVRRYHWDPTKWLIRSLEKMGLASNLRRVPRERIILARMRSDELRLRERLRDCSQEAVESVQARLAEISAAVENAVSRLGALEREFARVRANAADVSKERLLHLRTDLRSARKEFREAWRSWTHELARLPDSLSPAPVPG